MIPADIATAVFAAITNQNLVAKVIIILIAVVYTLFALILNRQISLLSGMVNQITFSSILKGISLLHVISAVGILLYAAFVL